MSAGQVQTKTVQAISPKDVHLLLLLERHPDVELEPGASDAALTFALGNWKRRIWIGRSDIKCHGLVELMDNNPMVCADEVSVPTPGSTLALIALGPLAKAGIIAEKPSLMGNFPADELDLAAFLATEGWDVGASYEFVENDLGSVFAMTAMAVITVSDNLESIDALYEECFGRSFYVRRDEDSEWHTQLVQDQPHALYRLRITPGEDSSLLTVQVMADRFGKCGAAQVVHAMNVMAGFEETLGIG